MSFSVKLEIQTISFQQEFLKWLSSSRICWCHCLQINVGRSLEGIACFLQGCGIIPHS
jgi:hypothetical protein